MVVPITIGQLSEAISRRAQRHIEAWQIRRTIKRGLLPEPPRVGAYRAFSSDQIPAVESALRTAGYLPKE